MKYILSIIICLALFSCHDVKVAFLKEVTVRGNGAFDIPVYNNIPAGTYQISLQVENEDYSDILEDIFTIVVKE
jgi:hypothetical protein